MPGSSAWDVITRLNRSRITSHRGSFTGSSASFCPRRWRMVKACRSGTLPQQTQIATTGWSELWRRTQIRKRIGQHPEKEAHLKNQGQLERRRGTRAPEQTRTNTEQEQIQKEHAVCEQRPSNTTPEDRDQPRRYTQQSRYNQREGSR